MANNIVSSFAWWEARRLRYNIGLIAAGLLAFVAYFIVGCTLLPADAHFNVPGLITLLHGIGYLVMIGLANIFYCLGPFGEMFVRAAHVVRYRRICYGLGFWFSVLLPFTIPVLLTVLALFYPSYWKNSP